jgi:hypothetical protein
MKIRITESQYNYLVEQPTPPVTSGGTTTVVTPQQQRLKQSEDRKKQIEDKNAKLEAERQERIKAFAIKDSLRKEKNKIVWKKSYDNSEGKKKGQDFDTWYNEFESLTKKNAAENPEPKGERTFWGGNNGPKSPCKGGRCSGLNTGS